MTTELVSDAELQQIAGDLNYSERSYIGFGTVKQYCDFFDAAPRLATFNNDMKDLQRCWMLRHIASNVPRGAQLLEIGAGEPVVGQLLSRLGYKVIIVDPYEGFGNGPQGIGSFRDQYPDVKIVQDKFDFDTVLPSGLKIDCFYSISVLEHISKDEIYGMYRAMKKFSQGSYSAHHAIDCVIGGNGSEFHRALVSDVCQIHGIESSEVERVFSEITSSNETYYLSAEAHNRWRGDTRYMDFPMRKCVSIHLAQYFDE